MAGSREKCVTRRAIDSFASAFQLTVHFARSVWQADFDYLPINFLVGKGVTLPGTIGHVKSVLDSMLRRGQLKQVIWLKVTPTIMVGEIDDPHFEEHLKEGPYIVFYDQFTPAAGTAVFTPTAASARA